MAKPKGPFQILGSAERFNAILAEFPGLAGRKVERVLTLATQTARDEIVEGTPLGATGKAKRSFYYLNIGPYQKAVASFLIYIMRLEVGWGARRLGVRKGRRAMVGHLTLAGRKMPIGGYRMMSRVANRMPQIIRAAAQQVLDEA